jgi:hypothetical protein
MDSFLARWYVFILTPSEVVSSIRQFISIPFQLMDNREFTGFGKISTNCKGPASMNEVEISFCVNGEVNIPSHALPYIDGVETED